MVSPVRGLRPARAARAFTENVPKPTSETEPPFASVEVTLSKVRRERMGHIELAVPVAHIWFFKTLPSQLGYLLGMTLRDLEKVIYYAAYVVTNPGKQEVEFQQLLDEDEYYDLRVKAREEGDEEFRAEIGAEAARTLLRLLDNPDKKKIKDRNADGRGLDRLGACAPQRDPRWHRERQPGGAVADGRQRRHPGGGPAG